MGFYNFANLTLDIVERKLDEHFSLLVNFLCLSFQLQKRSVTKIVSGISIFVLFASIFHYSIANIISIIYPAYKSTMSILGKNSDFKLGQSSDPLADQQWLIYWIVLSLLMFVESTGPVTLFSWIPFYGFIRIVFLIWLMSSYTHGANKIFIKIIIPLLKKYQLLLVNDSTETETKPLTAMNNVNEQNIVTESPKNDDNMMMRNRSGRIPISSLVKPLTQMVKATKVETSSSIANDEPGLVKA